MVLVINFVPRIPQVPHAFTEGPLFYVAALYESLAKVVHCAVGKVGYLDLIYVVIVAFLHRIVHDR